MNVDFFVQNVKAHCRIMGISPSRACRDSGAGETLLDNVKRGRIPSIDRIEMLAKFFDCTIGELIGEDTSGLSRGPDQPYLVRRYNSLSKKAQEEAMAFIEFKALQEAGGKKEDGEE